VSSLAALAHGALSADDSETLVAVLDARRGEVYAGAYRRHRRGVIAIGDERVFAPREVTTLAADARYTGDAAASYPELASLPGLWGATPSGRAVAELALAGHRVDVLVSGAPTYIRPSEAEVKYPQGVPGALRKR
jgi:tRNA threonylcarbamoyladenosine biosynthesis protein TsaB